VSRADFMNAWIQTSKTLPVSQYVVAWNGRQFFAAFADDDGNFIEVGGERVPGVTHWTPFPLAPDGFAYQRAPHSAYEQHCEDGPPPWDLELREDR
jgi:hypothetical protein